MWYCWTSITNLVSVLLSLAMRRWDTFSGYRWNIKSIVAASWGAIVHYSSVEEETCQVYGIRAVQSSKRENSVSWLSCSIITLKGCKKYVVMLRICQIKMNQIQSMFEKCKSQLSVNSICVCKRENLNPETVVLDMW